MKGLRRLIIINSLRNYQSLSKESDFPEMCIYSTCCNDMQLSYKYRMFLKNVEHLIRTDSIWYYNGKISYTLVVH